MPWPTNAVRQLTADFSRKEASHFVSSHEIHGTIFLWLFSAYSGELSGKPSVRHSNGWLYIKYRSNSGGAPQPRITQSSSLLSPFSSPRCQPHRGFLYAHALRTYVHIYNIPSRSRPERDVYLHGCRSKFPWGRGEKPPARLSADKQQISDSTRLRRDRSRDRIRRRHTCFHHR